MSFQSQDQQHFDAMGRALRHEFARAESLPHRFHDKAVMTGQVYGTRLSDMASARLAPGAIVRPISTYFQGVGDLQILVIAEKETLFVEAQAFLRNSLPNAPEYARIVTLIQNRTIIAYMPSDASAVCEVTAPANVTGGFEYVGDMDELLVGFRILQCWVDYSEPEGNTPLTTVVTVSADGTKYVMFSLYNVKDWLIDQGHYRSLP